MFVCWGGGGAGVAWVLTCRVRVRVRGWVLTCIIGCNSLFTGRCASNLEGGPGKGGLQALVNSMSLMPCK